MDILTRRKRFNQMRVSCHVCKDAQLNLAVIGGNQQVPRLRHKRVPNLSPELRSDRDVLEVRIHTTQATSGGNRLLEGGVNPAVRLHKFR